MDALTALIQQSRPHFRTATAFVAETLRRAICAGAIDAGAALKQDDLASAFGVSRMPVREALRQLEAEGLVDFVPHRGAIVKGLEPGEIAEIFEIRRVLEIYALKRSVPNLTDKDLARAGGFLKRADRQRTAATRRALNREFHLALYAGLQGTRLLKIIETQYQAVDRHFRRPGLAFEKPDLSHEEHREILELCTKRDVRGAEKALKHHFAEGQRKLQQAIDRVAV